MAITAAEQYGIELLNRARLDPAGEARRYGVGLNDGVKAHWDASSTPSKDRHYITADQKQVLSPNDALGISSQRHSAWMLSTDTFSHTGAGGTQPDTRMTAAGYARFVNPSPYNWSYGENLVYVSLSGKSRQELIGQQHEDLMLSPGHRENILRDSFREIGYSQELGSFEGSHGSMVTENFASRGSHVFVTGVAYTDRNDNDFYSVGEGRGDVRFTQAGHGTDLTATSGGYAVRVAPGANVEIKISAGSAIAKVVVDTRDNFNADPKNANINVKLDLVDGHTLYASSNLRLVSGAPDAKLLGINPFSLIGSGAANELTGNQGNNRISGMDGNDTLVGQNGRDNLIGNAGNDRLFGGNGNDKLAGGIGNDRLTGGAGEDHFVFATGGGSDHVIDFKGSAGDTLVLDHDLWGGRMTANQVVREFADIVNGDLVLDFGNGNVLTLDDWGYKSKLAGYIDII